MRGEDNPEGVGDTSEREAFQLQQIMQDGRGSSGLSEVPLELTSNDVFHDLGKRVAWGNAKMSELGGGVASEKEVMTGQGDSRQAITRNSA